MLVIFGANGRTGVEIVRLALQRGLDVRAVVRDDRDAAQLNTAIPVGQISYADPNEYASLPPALQGASKVICCIDPRTGGPGTPIYDESSSSNVVRAAAEVGAENVLYLSVMGAFRWSPNALNRKAFHLERGVRALTAPWTLFRVSCYMDELIEGHVRPPDGGRPHGLKPSSRYSPVSRREAARMALDYLCNKAVPGRQVCVGGPRVWTGAQLTALIAPWREPGKGRTKYRPLPPGDVSVMPETTLVTSDYTPQDTVEDYLDPSAIPPKATEPPPVYAREAPGPHPSDAGKALKVLEPMATQLRYVLHDQLCADLPRLGLSSTDISLDFSRARKRKNGRSAEAHDGTISELQTVKIVDETGIFIHQGSVDFIHDKLARELHCFWSGEGIPDRVWQALDLGVKRRVAADPHFADEPQSQAFRTDNP
jgi:uncharacterized protein YbjT (DUF2867 family)